MSWEFTLAAISLLSVVVQRLVEIVGLVLDQLPFFGPDATTDVGKQDKVKKLVLVLTSLVAGALCANYALPANPEIFMTKGTTAQPPQAIIPEGMQVFVLTLIISGGTEAFNSISKFLEYTKDGRRVEAEVKKLELEVISSVSFTPAEVKGESSVTGVVMLTDPAKTGGVIVTLTSNNNDAKLDPPFVTVQAGSKTAFFQVRTSAVTSRTPVTIMAQAERMQKSGSFTVVP